MDGGDAQGVAEMTDGNEADSTEIRELDESLAFQILKGQIDKQSDWLVSRLGTIVQNAGALVAVDIALVIFIAGWNGHPVFSVIGVASAVLSVASGLLIVAWSRFGEAAIDVNRIINEMNDGRFRDAVKCSINDVMAFNAQTSDVIGTLDELWRMQYASAACCIISTLGAVYL